MVRERKLGNTGTITDLIASSWRLCFKDDGKPAIFDTREEADEWAKGQCLIDYEVQLSLRNDT
jgi:hypothetical protein